VYCRHGRREHGVTSVLTHYRLYGRRFLPVERPIQLYQSTEGKATKDNNPKTTKKTENTHMHTHKIVCK